jgi:chemotaxis protein histidine kinase CheA
MAENKGVKVGQTVYLKEGESFDSVGMPVSGQVQEQAGQSVRATPPQQARPLRVSGQNPSIARATQPQQPFRPQQQPQQQPQAERSFVRASKMPVTVQDPEPQVAEPVQERSFIKASKMPVQAEDIQPQAEPIQAEQPRVENKVAEEKVQASMDRLMQMLKKSKEETAAVKEEENQSADETQEETPAEEPENLEEQQKEEEREMESFENKSIAPIAAAEASAAAETRRKARPIDISKISVLSKNEIDKEKDLRQALFNNKAAFQIVASQSGYVAKVAPLVYKDIVNMLNSSLSTYEEKRTIYKTIHDKVFETSVGKMDFDSWLKGTTVEDMETFYYGVYSATFPNEGTWRFTCPKCGKEHDYKINNNSLIQTKDRGEIKKRIDEISREAITPERMKAFSLIGKNEAVQLSDSKLIVELRTPSLNDALEVLRTVPEKSIEKDINAVTNMLYVNRVLIPAKDSLGHSEESSRTSILRIIDSLPIDDAIELQGTILDRVQENRISYALKNIKCVECGEESGDEIVSLEKILFTLIFEKAQ